MTTTGEDEKRARHPGHRRIAAVVSDVDGTLVADDKSLPGENRAAVAKLRAAGIAFALISSRPPRGMTAVANALGGPLMVGGFNGGILSTLADGVLDRHLLAPDLAGHAVEALEQSGVAVWVFSGQDWYLRDPNQPHVAREIHTVGFEPTVVADFTSVLDGVGKIVGVSADAAALGRCEATLRAELSDSATVVRSQLYYLDITHTLANKGAGVRSIARHLGVPLSEVAVIGDGPNDVEMFEAAGLSIAMANAEPSVQRAADVVTGSNNHAGFAEAMGRFVLGGG
jgi:Cof subfamily protein (haloacid dehalogenase superfamily)